MAQVVPHLTTAAIDHETKTHVDPLVPNETPQSDDAQSEGDTTHGASDATLYDGSSSLSTSGGKEVGQESIQDGFLERPRLAPRKYETEISHPVGGVTIEPLRPIRTTLNDHHDRDRELMEVEVDSETSTSTSSSSEEEEEEESPFKLQRSKTQPDYKPISKARLNRVRTHPKQSNVEVKNDFFQTQGRVSRDGRLNISVNETANTGYLAKALGATIQRHLGPHHLQELKAAEQAKADFIKAKPSLLVPRMNILIMVIGSRGDIQPFLKIGKILKEKYNHRVRIATHPTFKKFIEEDIGLEFFSVGGDPAELMAFMVKNPGLIPSIETVKAGEIGRRRESMFQMFQGFWRACINATDDETDTANLKMMGSKPPFVADAIIANPPSFAHYHCAERLSIPLHLIFTFPYSPTQAFPHPLANIKASNVDQRYTNFMSYPLVDLMTWQGLGDLINRFREQTLGLDPVSTLWAPGQLYRLRVPTTYLWSPGLVPKPRDWGPEIDIAGYVFLDLASKYKPPDDLAKFLERSDNRPIIYIGFGSIAGIDNPLAFTKMIFEGVEKAGVRAVISRGWGGMGDGMEECDDIFMIDNVPHDWLFPHVDAVVHHGGAGTTAAGLKFGKPTMIVPFFGDQPFWSAMVAKAGAGVKEALPLKKLNSDRVAEGIRQCLLPETKARAEEIARSIHDEGDGAENAVDSFHRALNFDGPPSLRCNIFHDRVAVWRVRGTGTHLSALAADLLVENKELQWADLELIRNHEWTDFHGPGEPITGAGGVVVQAFQNAYHGLAEMHDTAKKDIQYYEQRWRRRRSKSIAQGVVLPGRIAYASRGTSIEEQRREIARDVRRVNFQGEAVPSKSLFAQPSTDEESTATASGLTRTATESSENRPPAFVVILKDVGKGIGQSSRAIAVLPLQMWNALALGFHNAPRLYGDRTVRPSPQRITGFRAGIQAASKEFWLGLYDGVTGLVRIPYQEVHDSGVAALPKGMAIGFGGLVLKPISGILGLGAYTAQGVHSSLRRRVKDTEKTERWIRRARITQGQRDVQELQKPAKKPAERPPGRPTEELQEVRNHALRHWATYEKDKVSEARLKEHRASLLAHSHQGEHLKQPPRAQTQ